MVACEELFSPNHYGDEVEAESPCHLCDIIPQTYRFKSAPTLASSGGLKVIIYMTTYLFVYVLQDKVPIIATKEQLKES